MGPAPVVGIALLVGALGFGFVWLATPHGREIGAAWELGVKLGRLRLPVLARSRFFPWVSERLHWLLYVPFSCSSPRTVPRG